CHDHKYDPIDQREYYEFRAIFEPQQVRTDRLPGQSNLMKDGLPRAYDAELNAPTYVYLRGDEKQPDKEHPAVPAVPKMFSQTLDVSPVKLPPIARFPAVAKYIQQEDLAAAQARLTTAQTKWEQVRDASANHAPQPQSQHHDRPPSPIPAEDLVPQVELARLARHAAELELASLQARWKADRVRYDRDAALPADESQVARHAREAAGAERASNLAAAERELFTQLLKQRETDLAAETDTAKRRAAIKKATDEVAKLQTALLKARSAASKVDDKYTAIGTAYPATSTGRRLALARWIVDPQNPLTARVAVNHVWMHHFGQPLVENVFDFGLRTPTPPLADVLDWLAADLIDNGWDMKRLHRWIVTSRAYQRASSAETSLMALNASIDPDNRYLWRSHVRRLEAEVIRDNLLAVAGQLDSTRGGPDIDQGLGETVYRRSLYFRHAYEKQMTMLTTFDAANPTDCYRRSTSIVPQQALALSNSTLSVSMARLLASQLAELAPDSPDQEFIQHAFRRLLGRLPDHLELAACQTFLAEQQQLLAKPSQLSAIGGQAKADAAAATAPAARTRENLLHTLMNHNDFVTVR
ncbi:MAG: DUF1553 domain-containing protein, partial [Planctomycetaceae bacterium]